MTTVFGFDEECSSRYSKQLYSALVGAFNCLPIAAVVNEKFFCVHGGLSPDVSRIEDIELIHRFREIPSSGGMCDLLWSDPYWDVENPTTGDSAESEYYTPLNAPFDMEPTFSHNEQRGCSYIFNFACVKHFVNVNNILCVIRSHEIQDDGYKLYRPHPNNNFPAMMSVFSAPNYSDTFENKGAIICITNNDMEVKQFFCSPHPFVLLGQNGFTWSLPFMADSLSTIFNAIVNEE
ncbi:protein phosphatase 3, catalytic subunit [Angomonas deanei]|nr:protein phosphatase 3, catalytic subunit [Angomonas deanei]|eukprot:EPY26562.1 protein phosphatase 3, catalytic subunit [Angomonas deanei]